VVLFVIAACAVLAAGGLTAVVLADDDTRPVAAAGDRPSPSARPSATRAVGPPMCLIGSWRTVDERAMIKFYNNEDPFLFTMSGRVYEFRPDGTGVERMDNVVYSATFEGNEVRLVGNGTSEFTWSATDTTITYIHRTKTDHVWQYYDQRGLIETQALESDKPVDEVDQYTCQGAQMVESKPDTGYRGVWARTSAFGVYG
jgi:hypothetical protein